MCREIPRRLEHIYEFSKSAVKYRENSYTQECTFPRVIFLKLFCNEKIIEKCRKIPYKFLPRKIVKKRKFPG